MATIMRKMNIISRCESIYRVAELSVDLPGIYHSYILSICHMPGMSQEEISKHICINKSSVARHVAFLEKNGYVLRKVCDKDKREMRVYPTDKMLSIYDEVVEITRKWNALVAEDISEEELAAFHKILDKMSDKSKEIVFKGEK